MSDQHTNETREFVEACNRGSEQARQTLQGSALPRLARILGESVKRNRGKVSS